jgi:adenylate cyclase
VFRIDTAERAAGLLLARIARNPSTDASRLFLASCYGHLGCIDEARKVWTALLEVNPGSSVAQRAEVLPYRNAADIQHIIDGLSKAGLPDRP